jgi:hypothetical protein
MPIVIKTTPFQNPRNEPVAPTASRSGSDRYLGLVNDATRFVVGATHVASSTTKIINGMSTYCRKDKDDRLGGGLRYRVTV